MQAVTIVARNHLPFVAALAGGFRRHHPSARLVAVVVDDPPEGATIPGVELVDAAAIGVPRDELARLRTLYGRFELTTALKPRAIAALLAAGADVVLYLDADIRVLASLDGLGALARRHGFVLTPHLTTPLPRDGKEPGELDVLRAGAFNMGFLAAAAAAAPFLAWWEERVRRDCVIDVAAGLFVDQRWVDLVPGLFGGHVLTDPTCNVAYWNVAERELSRGADGTYRVGGAPLAFFHFSGFDPLEPGVLSRHARRRPRADARACPALAALCAEEATDVLEAGWRAAVAEPYRLDVSDDGIALDARVRGIYRQALVEAERAGAALPPAAFGGAPGAFGAWLRAPAAAGGAVSRYLHAVWSERPDLRAAFPDPLGSDAPALARWGATSGAREVASAAALLVAAASLG